MTTDELLSVARRELAMRQRVYPRLVAQDRMTQAKADHEIEAMEEIVKMVEIRAQVDELF